MGIRGIVAAAEPHKIKEMAHKIKQMAKTGEGIQFHLMFPLSRFCNMVPDTTH